MTSDDRLILSSEAGALDIDPAKILVSGSLGPGQMLMVDPEQGRVLYDDEIRDELANEKPYREWIKSETLALSSLIEGAEASTLAVDDEDLSLTERQAVHGFCFEDIEEAIIPMADIGAVPLASMGEDTPLACLSERPRRFYHYFNQLFSQVTNPPIDALRESYITSTLLYLGNHGNLLEDARANCRLVRLETPLLNEAQFAALATIGQKGFKAARIVAAYSPDGGEHALADAVEKLGKQAEELVRSGVNILVLSDRAGRGLVPVPSLLSVASVHNHLLRCGIRTQVDLIVECGDAVTPHDFATLVGYSASGIYPYLAHDTIRLAVCSPCHRWRPR